MSTYVDPNNLPRETRSERFATQSSALNFGSGRLYNISGEWQAGPLESSPDATRVVFDSLNAYACARDVYDAWQDIEALRSEVGGERTRLPDKAYARLARARETQEPVTLFVPWGIKTNWRSDMATRPRPELQVLERVADFQRMLAACNIPSQVLIMPADVYATEVNNFDQAVADEYMSWLRQQADGYGFQIKSWSEIRRENQARYEVLKAEYRLDKLEDNRATSVRLSSAYRTAAKRSGYMSLAEQRQAGYRYVSERMIEARIVDEVYGAIKLSCVTPEKDNVVDVDLPRIYTIPDELRFPWLKGARDERI